MNESSHKGGGSLESMQESSRKEKEGLESRNESSHEQKEGLESMNESSNGQKEGLESMDESSHEEKEGLGGMDESCSGEKEQLESMNEHTHNNKGLESKDEGSDEQKEGLERHIAELTENRDVSDDQMKDTTDEEHGRSTKLSQEHGRSTKLSQEHGRNSKLSEDSCLSGQKSLSDILQEMLISCGIDTCFLSKDLTCNEKRRISVILCQFYRDTLSKILLTRDEKWNLAQITRHFFLQHNKNCDILNDPDFIGYKSTCLCHFGRFLPKYHELVDAFLTYLFVCDIRSVVSIDKTQLCQHLCHFYEHWPFPVFDGTCHLANYLCQKGINLMTDPEFESFKNTHIITHIPKDRDRLKAVDMYTPVVLSGTVFSSKNLNQILQIYLIKHEYSTEPWSMSKKELNHILCDFYQEYINVNDSKLIEICQEEGKGVQIADKLAEVHCYIAAYLQENGFEILTDPVFSSSRAVFNYAIEGKIHKSGK